MRGLLSLLLLAQTARGGLVSCVVEDGGAVVTVDLVQGTDDYTAVVNTVDSSDTVGLSSYVSSVPEVAGDEVVLRTSGLANGVAYSLEVAQSASGTIVDQSGCVATPAAEAAWAALTSPPALDVDSAMDHFSPQLGDLDGDGDRDFVLGGQVGSAPALAVYRNDGSDAEPLFELVETITDATLLGTSNMGAPGPAVGLMDPGDDFPDLVVGRYESAALRVRSGSELGALPSPGATVETVSTTHDSSRAQYCPSFVGPTEFLLGSMYVDGSAGAVDRWLDPYIAPVETSLVTSSYDQPSPSRCANGSLLVWGHDAGISMSDGTTLSGNTHCRAQCVDDFLGATSLVTGDWGNDDLAWSALGTAPNPVVVISVEAKAPGYLDVTWEAPAASVPPVTQYIVQPSASGAVPMTVDADVLTARVLVSGSSTVSVTAVNAVGSSAPYPTTAAVEVLSGDAAPLDVLCVPGDGAVEISWPEGWEGDLVLALRKADSSAESQVAVGGLSSYMWTGLENGVEYVLSLADSEQCRETPRPTGTLALVDEQSYASDVAQIISFLAPSGYVWFAATFVTPDEPACALDVTFGSRTLCTTADSDYKPFAMTVDSNATTLLMLDASDRSVRAFAWEPFAGAYHLQRVLISSLPSTASMLLVSDSTLWLSFTQTGDFAEYEIDGTRAERQTTPSVSEAPNSYGIMARMDVDDDGLQDVVALSPSKQALRTLLNDGGDFWVVKQADDGLFGDLNASSVASLGSSFDTDVNLFVTTAESNVQVWAREFAPAGPANLRVTDEDVCAGTMTVAWDAVDDALTYTLEVDGDVACATVETSCLVASLVAGTGDYELAVVAVLETGFTDATELLHSTGDCSLSAPAWTSVAVVGDAVQLEWSESSASHTYTLMVNDSAVEDIEDPRYNVTDAEPGSILAFQVQAAFSLFTSDWSEPAYAHIAPLPAAPTNLAATASGRTITFTWDAVDGADSYLVVEYDLYVDEPSVTLTDSDCAGISISVQSVASVGLSEDRASLGPAFPEDGCPSSCADMAVDGWYALELAGTVDYAYCASGYTVIASYPAGLSTPVALTDETGVPASSGTIYETEFQMAWARKQELLALATTTRFQSSASSWIEVDRPALLASGGAWDTPCTSTQGGSTTLSFDGVATLAVGAVLQISPAGVSSGGALVVAVQEGDLTTMAAAAATVSSLPDVFPLFEFDTAPTFLDVEARVDGGPWTAWNTSFPKLATAAEGSLATHSIEARAVAAFGVSAPSLTATWQYDLEPPTPVFEAQPPAHDASDSATFTISTLETYGAVYEWSLDGGADAGVVDLTLDSNTSVPETTLVEQTDSSVTVSGTGARIEVMYDQSDEWAVLADATTATLQLNASSAATWNSVSLRSSFGWQVADATPVTVVFSAQADTTPPVASFATDAVTTAALSRVEFNCSEACTVGVKVDEDAEWTPLDADGDNEGFLQGRGAGMHLLRFRAMDAAGNRQLDPMAAAVLVIAEPQLTFELAPAAETTQRWAVVRWVVGDGSLDWQSAAHANPVELSDLAVGKQSLTVTAALAANARVEASATLEWEVVLDGDANDTSSYSLTFEGLAESAHSLEVRGVDQANNTAESVVEWVVDQTAPVVEGAVLTPSSEVDGVWTSADFAVSGNLSEPGSFEVVLNGAVVTALDDGTHDLEVWGLDEAGNRAAEPVLFEGVVVDTTAPNVALDAPALSANATVVVSAACDEACTAVVLVDGVAAAELAHGESAALELGADGNHSVAADVVDQYNNSAQGAALRFVVVDTTPPDTFVGEGEEVLTAETALNLTVSCSDDDACTYAYSMPLTDLADGVHTVFVAAVDAAGNEDPTPAVVNVTVDTTPPVLGDPLNFPRVVTTLLGEEVRLTSEREFDITPVVSDLTAVSVAMLVDGAPASNTSVRDDGAHTLTLVATDALGHSATRAWVWELDTEPPSPGVESDGPADESPRTFDAWCESAPDECGGDVVEDLDCAFAWRLDNAAEWTEVNGTDIEVFVTLPGTYEMELRARDSAGLTTDIEYEFELVAETWVDIVDAPALLSGSDSAFFSWEASVSASEEEVYFSYELTLNGDHVDFGDLPTYARNTTVALPADANNDFQSGLWVWTLVLEPFGSSATFSWQTDSCAAEGEAQSLGEGGALSCLACPAGVECSDGEVELLPGYWRSKAGSDLADGDSFSACHVDGACLGGNECAAGYQGVLCAVCADGFGRNLDGTCSECAVGDEASPGILAALSAAVAAVALVAVFIVFKSLRATQTVSVVATLKIVANYFLMMSILRDYQLDWGSLLDKMFAMLGVASGAGVADTQVVSCTLPVPLFTRYALYFAIPVGIVVVSFVGVLVGASYSKWHTAANSWRDVRVRGHRPFFLFRHAVLVLVYFAYPVFVTTAFRVLHCEEVEGQLYLVDDYGELCDDRSSYQTLRAVALLYIGVVAPGIPLFLAVTLRRHRGELDKSNKVRQHLWFLFGDFDPRWYAWEVTVMLRKAAMGAIAVLLSNRDAELQVYAGLWLLLAVTVAQIAAGPHRDPLQRHLETAALSAVTLSLLLGQALSMDSISQRSQEQIRVAIALLNFAVMLGFVMVFDVEAVKQVVRTFFRRGGSESPSSPEAEGVEMRSRASRVRLSRLFDSPASHVPLSENPMRRGE